MSFPDEHVPEEEGAGAGSNGPEGPEFLQKQAPAPPPGSGPGGAPGPAGEPGPGGVPGTADPRSTLPAEEADPREQLARERDEYLLALQRTQADFENYRKRIARLQDEQTARAASGLVEKVLPVLDTLDLAEAHLNESLDVGEDGKALRASRAMLMDILTREGLERVDQAEVPFDPSVHDAVAHSEGEGGEDGQTMVEEVLRSGYRWKGQVLRAAMVRVRG